MKNELKIIGFLTLIVIFCGFLYSWGTTLIKNQDSEAKLYKNMKEISENQSLIGLSPEEVVALLGNPVYEYRYKEDGKLFYSFYAGRIFNKTFFSIDSGREFYELRVYFNENDKVERTYIKLST